MRMQMLEPSEHPDFLDLPWLQPLASWQSKRLVAIPQGLHRHVVRFVDYDGALYVLKELPPHLAEREYRILRHLDRVGLPVVDVVGIVSDRDDAAGGESVLVTRHLDYSLPYRMLLGNERMPHLRERVLDALAGLLVRIHLAGFFWGDCSLANTLFRRDAGALTAYVVDTETGELHATLSDGQRAIDLQIAHENIAGGLLDLQAAGELPDAVDPIASALAVGERYEVLWTAVTEVESFRLDETYRIAARIQRLNELGFDVEEVELTQTPDTQQVLLKPRVVELGYHGPRLRELTGLRTQENQAKRLLNDIAFFRATLEQDSGRPISETVAAARWLDRIFEPTIEKIPAELRGKLEPAEVFHQILEHRWFLSEERGADVGMDDATVSYVTNVLPLAPDERSVIQVDAG